MRFVIVALFIFVAAPALAGRDSSKGKSVVHEETSSIWDEFANHFRDFSSRFREHFEGSRERGERPLISMMLGRREELGLSSEQVRSLERLRTDFERDAVKTQGDLRVAELDLGEILKADSVDVKQAEAKVREIERLRADLRVGRIRAIEQAKAVLTQEQREKVRAMAGENRYSRKSQGEKPKGDKPQGEKF